MERYEDIANRYLDIRIKSGYEWMCMCCFHNNVSTPSLQFNVRTGLWNCFVCERVLPDGSKKMLGGTAKQLVERLGHNFKEPSVGLDSLRLSLALLELPMKEESPAIEESKLHRFDIPTNYWRKRGFTDETITRFNLGYDIITDRVTIPYRDLRGHLRGIIFRQVDEDIIPKYKYPAGFPRSSSLFNSWNVAKSPLKSVAIVEGALDAIRCDQAGVQAVAQYGSSIHENQIKLLHKLGVEQVTLFYDNDPAGFSATLKALHLLKGFFINVVNYPPTYPSDPGAMSNKQIRKCVRTSIEW